MNFAITSGQICALVGLNGIGKTTIIKSILGIIFPDSGSILIKNNDYKNYSSRDDIFYLPEKFAPNPNLTAREYINFVLSFYKVELNNDKLNKLIKDFNLPENFLTSRIGKYSKGMTQKLGLIAMVLSNRNLWILDEPTSGLDPMGRYELKKVLLNHAKNGGSILFSSHILSDVEEISDQVVILHNTKIMYDGTASDLKLKYNTQNCEEAFMKLCGYELEFK
ncbi:MAG: hypothetical protein BGO27_08195 [Alphaproteobacteria bacterium 33-17]|nr:MAG: hypothetical protein BGO27_08195 [Alphaproteobacteria bacterium 33-17]